jgi:hypothetical protein
VDRRSHYGLGERQAVRYPLLREFTVVLTQDDRDHGPGVELDHNDAPAGCLTLDEAE